MTMDQILDFLSKGGLLGGMLIIFWAGLTERWVWGWTYRRALIDRDTAHETEKAILQRQIDALIRERESLWQFALKTTGVLDKTLDVGSRVTAAANLALHGKEGDG
jgi:hypothetical protein